MNRVGGRGDHPGLSELARACHTTVNTVLQAAWAQLLVGLTGQHDVAFGTAVSGRPTEIPGAETMVGLLINTVPVRATITPTTTATELLDQLQRAHTDTLDHQHLGLTEIHRVTGQDQLFDTLFVYENYPIDTAALSGADGLAITDFAGRESNHYPLTLQATPGPNWACASNTTPTCSSRHVSRRWSSGWSGCWWPWPPIRRRGCRRWTCSTPTSTPGWTGRQSGGVDCSPPAGLDPGAVRRAGVAPPDAVALRLAESR